MKGLSYQGRSVSCAEVEYTNDLLLFYLFIYFVKCVTWNSSLGRADVGVSKRPREPYLLIREKVLRMEDTWTPPSASPARASNGQPIRATGLSRHAAFHSACSRNSLFGPHCRDPHFKGALGTLKCVSELEWFHFETQKLWRCTAII